MMLLAGENKMLRRWTVCLVLGAAVAACGGDEGGEADAESVGDDSGKADDVDDLDPEDCSLEAGDERELALFENNSHVQMRCRGATGFVQTACCIDEIRQFEFITGCPMQAKFNNASGSEKRCVQDQPDSGEVVSGELFVPTMCCELLCDPAAGWDDPDTQSSCRNSAGQFHPHVCCMMNDNARCGGAQFDAQPNAAGWRHCRAQEGDFAGQFAPAACCMDTCFDIIEAGEEDVPLECVIPVEEECTGAAPDANGICRTPEGYFAKGMCCVDAGDVDVPASDDCYEKEITGQELTGCEA